VINTKCVFGTILFAIIERVISSKCVFGTN
jgi:hypothetical protein